MPLISFGVGGRKTTMASEGAFYCDARAEFKTLPMFSGTVSHAFSGFVYMPVGSYAPNLYGLFDMVGNGIGEWCADDWNVNAYIVMMISETNSVIFDCERKPNDQIPCQKVARGGGWKHYNAVLNRIHLLPNATEKQERQYLYKTIHVAERWRV